MWINKSFYVNEAIILCVLSEVPENRKEPESQMMSSTIKCASQNPMSTQMMAFRNMIRISWYSGNIN